MEKLHTEKVFILTQNQQHNNRVIKHTIPINPQHDFTRNFDLLTLKITSHANKRSISRESYN